MKLRTLVLSLLVAAAPALARTDAHAQAAPAQSEPSADQIADRVQGFYDKTRTFAADFKQRYWIEVYQREKLSHGRVIFEKPGKMSWRYTSNGNRVVSDGKILRVYEQDNKQMFKQPVEKSQYPAALSFLVGGGNLKKSFKLKKLDAKRLGFTGGYVLLGEPKDPTPAYQKILMYVDAKTHQVRRVLLVDAQGNKNRFDFLKPVVNKKAPAGEFDFTPPKGTTIVKP